MDQHLTAFIEAHPEGWGHNEWLGLLAQLERAGFHIGDTDEIGLALEKQRLARELRERHVPGLGPKRIDAVVDRFGTLWSLRQADAGQLAEIKTIPGELAQRVVEAVR
jgi:hypothetical protein